MTEYVIFLKNGHALTIRAGAFTKTAYEVLFFEEEIVRGRNDKPKYEAAVASFMHEELAGFARKEIVES